ncbi:MAG: hypothetical protein KC503_17705 [Myxococcales bacterium]|nr:hypothetical protein [Myxococcales bacterium]
MTIDWGREDEPQRGYRFEPNDASYTSTIYYGPPLDSSKSSDAIVRIGDVQRFAAGRLYCFGRHKFAYVELRVRGRARGRLLRAELNEQVTTPDGGIYEWAFDLEDVYDVCTPWSDNDPPMSIRWSLSAYRERGAAVGQGQPCSYPTLAQMKQAHATRGMRYPRRR